MSSALDIVGKIITSALFSFSGMSIPSMASTFFILLPNMDAYLCNQLLRATELELLLLTEGVV